MLAVRVTAVDSQPHDEGRAPKDIRTNVGVAMGDCSDAASVVTHMSLFIFTSTPPPHKSTTIHKNFSSVIR